MVLFFITGFVFLLFSLLFLFAPKMLVKLSEISNKMIFTDYGAIAHRKWSGVVLLILSFLMFYLGVKI